MRLDLVKTRAAIRPATEQDEEKLIRVRNGDLLPVHIRKPRNGRLHRKFFALVNLIAQNHPRLDSVDAVILELKVRAHHYTERITLDGEIILLPKSISYEDLEELDFQAFFEKCVKIAGHELLPGIDQGKLDAYLDELAGFDRG
jgi:hypothetical protein